MGLFKNLSKNFKKTKSQDDIAARIHKMKLGRTKEQCSVIDYFTEDLVQKKGCLRKFKPTTDERLVELLNEKIASFNVEQRALEVLGLDESQVNEIKPIDLRGYDFDGIEGNEPFAKKGADKFWRSSAYEITRLYFSDKQIFFYTLNFDLTNNKMLESTKEFFYKDIVSFRTAVRTKETKVYDSKKKGCIKKSLITTAKYETHEYATFVLNVVGDSKKCVMSSNEERKQVFLALKAKIRDSKNSK